MVIPEIVTGVASNVVTELGKRAWRDRGTAARRLVSFVRRRPGQMVFIPEAAGFHVLEATDRKLMVRLILIGSAAWTRNREIGMEPQFTATVIPPGIGGYYFAADNRFTTAKVPRGMHAYYIGNMPLTTDHRTADPMAIHTVFFNGHITVERLGTIPIFPLAIQAGAYGQGGGFVNEPIELSAIRS